MKSASIDCKSYISISFKIKAKTPNYYKVYGKWLVRALKVGILCEI